ncbi:MAG: N-acetylglucosamine-6-sulfatase [Solirubrobacteraceae bacterium]|nr:N-acetylglucosamine-6-sulfatase [Solirubrobacteraceae bacterium]
MAVVSNEVVPDQPGQKGLDPDPGRLTVTRACAVGLTAILLACLALVACGGSSHSANATTRSRDAGALPGTAGTTPPVPPTNTTPGGAPVAATPPNIVFVLTDDLSMDLVQYMPHLVGLQSAGMTFSNYFVSDSLCCPSRSSLFTGQFPHNTGVFSNYGNDGGFRIFHRLGNEQRTFALGLQRQGYRTAMMGKYLNGYLAGARADGSPTALPASYIPPGWNEWDVAGWGYNEYNYRLNQDGRVRYYAHRPQDYLTNVIGGLGNRFISHSVAIGKPFFLELATFAPHAPYIPARQDRRSFPGLTAPRPPSFDRLPTGAPLWLAIHKPLRARQIVRIDRAFRRRVQSVQAVDRMIASIQQTLQARGVANDTYIVFSSDNGLHTGEYRLMPGKLTAFDTDIHVPLIVAGPGVPAGSTSPAMTENIDLAETFTAIAGTSISGDGHSLLKLLHGLHPRDWRNAILVEHHGSDLNGADPDFQQPVAGAPRTYEAIRTDNFLYVQYNDGESEYYNLRTDPFELHNLSASLTERDLLHLHADIARLQACHGSEQCWRAMHVGARA